MRLLMIHKACMPVYMNSGKIVADGTGGKFEGSTRGPRGPKKGGTLLFKITFPLLKLSPLYGPSTTGWNFMSL